MKFHENRWHVENEVWQIQTVLCNWGLRDIATRCKSEFAIMQSSGFFLRDFGGKRELPLCCCFLRGQTSECSCMAEVSGPVCPPLAPHKQAGWRLERTQQLVYVKVQRSSRIIYTWIYFLLLIRLQSSSDRVLQEEPRPTEGFWDFSLWMWSRQFPLRLSTVVLYKVGTDGAQAPPI